MVLLLRRSASLAATGFFSAGVAGSLLLSACDFFRPPAPDSAFPPEIAYHKESDLGTEVHRMTTHRGQDRIFYAQPNFTSPDGRWLLFKSDRDGDHRLYLMDIGSGEIRLLRAETEFGHIPTWSADGREVYVGGHGRITAVDFATRKERVIDVPGDAWLTFLCASPDGSGLLFVEEGSVGHEALGLIDPRDGSGYRTLHVLDHREEFFLDHPAFLDDSTVLFLTRGAGRDFTGDFNRPYVLPLGGEAKRLPLECSHYDVHPASGRILCGQDGYVLDRDGEILKQVEGLHGHGAWAPDGKRFLMTGDPVPVPSGSPWFGKIVLVPWEGGEPVSLVGHESTYDSSSDPHEQPNAQFSRDGKYILWESDRGERINPDIYRVALPR